MRRVLPGRRRPVAALAVLLALLAAVAAVEVGTAGPAAAHATLISTDPVEGEVLETAPDRITLTFDEPVVAVPDGVQVFDAEGAAVASSATVRDVELQVRLTDDVGDGTLVVTWRVVSTDGHPVLGSLSFAVGAPSATVVQPSTDRSSPTRAPPWLSMIRWLGYVGLLLASGLVAFTVLSLAGADVGAARRRLVTATRAGAAVGAAAWLVGLPLTGAYQLGAGPSSALSGSSWSTLAADEYVVAATVVLGLAAAVALLGSGRPSAGRGTAAVSAGALAAAAPALTGHTRAASPEALAVGADVLHLLTGSIWLGGLVGLALLVPALPGRGATAGEVLARFSGLAAGVLAVLVAAGSVLAWRIVGSWDALLGTGYGRLLLLKVGAAAVAVLLAAWNRYVLVPRVRRPAPAADRHAGSRLVARSTAAEAAVLAGVVLVTGFLVDTSPEGGSAAAAAPLTAAQGSPAPGTRRAALGDVVVEAELSPLRPGPTTVTVDLRHPAGGPAVGVESLSARLSSNGQDLEVPLSFVAEGTYTADVVLPAPGTWRLQVSVRRSADVNPATSLEFTVPAAD